MGISASEYCVSYAMWTTRLNWGLERRSRGHAPELNGSALANAKEINMVLSHPKDDRSRQIAILNDSFRSSFVGGTIFVTQGLQQVGDDFIKLALCAARQFVAFTGDSDP